MIKTAPYTKREQGGEKPTWLDYTQHKAEQFVKGLGTWTCAAPEKAILRRNPGEYKLLLEKLIEVNKTRTDAIGRYETVIAQRELMKMEAGCYIITLKKSL